MADGAPLKLIDIQQMLSGMGRAVTPNSLAFMLDSQIPATQPGIDPRRIPFNEISMQERAQRQQSLAQPQGQNNPFSLLGAVNNLNRQANTVK